MKKEIKLRLLSVLIFTFFASYTFAQNEMSKTQLFLLHEDEVLPYMNENYESALKDFVKMFSDANIDRTYNIIQMDFFKYTSIIPVSDFDGLAKYYRMSADVMKKIGNDKFEAAMKKFDGCYNTHRNYLLTLRNDLSYKPAYGLNPDDGLNFRHIDYLYVIPGKENEMMDVIKAWKEMCTQKNIEEGYRIYVSSMGMEMNMILVVQPAKDRTDFSMISDKQDKILGKEAGDLWKKLLSVSQKIEHNNGYMRPDLSYKPTE